ncbi:hypothetical protein F5B22DRAFT_320034 [Xylaria bambusicola]|uniref:uncharacterized protein n=1 Tax=Xylaria bambusicola TaxID=326684 RepID=UPI0020081480|nr:uncharacterized protein F5B22DRAFT_320034 [Xylaria bambusicola]KAI0509631.1 hypothetical protein F5B22DRAFT_320034 [Xylaria bambusicola]
MFISSPSSHHNTSFEPMDAFPKIPVKQRQLYYNRSSYKDSSDIMKQPVCFPNPPRPPTPGPPRPDPPMPPNPPTPTPPPSPQQLLSCSIGRQSSILASEAEPIRCPYPNPPPSPGPRRPGPVRPRPDVPTPPPSPRRSANPWILSTMSSLVDLALMYLVLTTWNADGVTEDAGLASEVDVCSERHSKSNHGPELTEVPPVIKVH